MRSDNTETDPDSAAVRGHLASIADKAWFRVRYVADGLGNGPWHVLEFEPGEFSGAEVGSYRVAIEASHRAAILNSVAG